MNKSHIIKSTLARIAYLLLVGVFALFALLYFLDELFLTDREVNRLSTWCESIKIGDDEYNLKGKAIQAGWRVDIYNNEINQVIEYSIRTNNRILNPAICYIETSDGAVAYHNFTHPDGQQWVED